MMNANAKHELHGRQLYNRSADQRRCRQVKRSAKLCGEQIHCVLVAAPRGPTGQVESRYEEVEIRQNHLNRLATGSAQRGTQSLMTPDKGSNCLLKDFRLQLPTQPESDSDVIGTRLGLNLL